MSLRKLLEVVGIIASGFVPFVPALKFAELAAGLAGQVANVVTADGTKITDENGVVLSNEELATRIQAKWAEAIAGVTRISQRADVELGRTDG